jgi:hypothetical protein
MLVGTVPTVKTTVIAQAAPEHRVAGQPSVVVRADPLAAAEDGTS